MWKSTKRYLGKFLWSSDVICYSRRGWLYQNISPTFKFPLVKTSGLIWLSLTAVFFRQVAGSPFWRDFVQKAGCGVLLLVGLPWPSVLLERKLPIYSNLTHLWLSAELYACVFQGSDSQPWFWNTVWFFKLFQEGGK